MEGGTLPHAAGVYLEIKIWCPALRDGLCRSRKEELQQQNASFGDLDADGGSAGKKRKSFSSLNTEAAPSVGGCSNVNASGTITPMRFAGGGGAGRCDKNQSASVQTFQFSAVLLLH